MSKYHWAIYLQFYFEPITPADAMNSVAFRVYVDMFIIPYKDNDER